ncbi:hypothetical protein EUA81_00090 [TM7 phylum sp. oral taxon 356]|nr:hypothetical protein EUA81_00090 [TM7 phylum sp. oral taxon 356]
MNLSSSAVGSGDGLFATGRTRLGNIIYEIITNLVGVTRLELATSSAVGSGDGLSATERTRLGNIVYEISSWSG